MKIRTIMSVVALGVVLAGCGGSGTVDNSGKSVESTKNRATRVEHKKTKKDPREVTNGELLKVGQWCNDEDQGRIELCKICAPGTEIDVGPVKYTVKSIKILKVKPGSSDQIEMAKANYQTNSVPNPYYTLQVVYDSENTSSDKLQLGGIESIVTSTGQQMSADGSGMYDDGAGASLAGNGKREDFSDSIINQGEYSKLTDITIKFAGSFTEDVEYAGGVESSAAVKISLENQ